MFGLRGKRGRESEGTIWMDWLDEWSKRDKAHDTSPNFTYHTSWLVPGTGYHSQHCVVFAACVVVVFDVVIAGRIAGGVVVVVVVVVVVAVAVSPAAAVLPAAAVFCSIISDDGLREQFRSFHIHMDSCLHFPYFILVHVLMASDVWVIISHCRVPVLNTHWSKLLHVWVRPLYTSHSLLGFLHVLSDLSYAQPLLLHVRPLPLCWLHKSASVLATCTAIMVSGTQTVLSCEHPGVLLHLLRLLWNRSQFAFAVLREMTRRRCRCCPSFLLRLKRSPSFLLRLKRSKFP